MELDDLKKAWREETARLLEQTELRVEQRLETRTALRSALTRLTALLVFELACAVAFQLLVVPFFVGHLGVPVLALGSGALVAAGAAELFAAVRQLGLVTAVDPAGPVLGQQQLLERLKLFRIRYTQTALVLGSLVGLGLGTALVITMMGSGQLTDNARAWLFANLAVMAALVMGFVWVSTRSRWARRIRDALGGESLQRALASLETLRAFEREEPPRP